MTFLGEYSSLLDRLVLNHDSPLPTDQSMSVTLLESHHPQMNDMSVS